MADAPRDAPQRPPERSGAGYAAIVAAAVLVAAPLTASFEGLRTHPNPDPANPNLIQVCYGDTQVAMRTYTPAQCLALLNEREVRDYAPPVLRCVPGFADPLRRTAFAASIDAAYNGGGGAFCRSRMARAFNANRWRQGCDGFLGWRATANGHVLRGLERRREAERALCLKALAPPPPPPPAGVPVTRADLQLCVPLKPYVAPPLGPARRPSVHPNNSEIS